MNDEVAKLLFCFGHDMADGQNMSDFDTIYEEADDEESIAETTLMTVPDPIVVRGAGNITMWDFTQMNPFRSRAPIMAYGIPILSQRKTEILS